MCDRGFSQTAVKTRQSSPPPPPLSLLSSSFFTLSPPVPQSGTPKYSPTTIHPIYTTGTKKMYTHLNKGKNCIEIVMVLCSSNENFASAIFFDCPACRMVTLAFI
jgi:hypothetical protein